MATIPNYFVLALLVELVVAITMCTTFTHGFVPVDPPRRTPSPVVIMKQNTSEEFLTTHNKARSEVGVGPLKWSMKLASDTSRLVRYQRNKMGCQFANMSLTEYGMNQMKGSGGVMMIRPSEAVELWVDKNKYYNHTDNTCAPHHSCGVYKQVVWKRSTELGCAQATCITTTLTICLYHPPGNIVGQKPY